MRLWMEDIWAAPAALRNQLIVVEHDLTPADCDSYDRIGWHHFRPEHLIETCLPEIGPARYYSRHCSIYHPHYLVAAINNQRYRINFGADDHHEAHEPDGKWLELTPTDEAETSPDVVNGALPRAHYYLKLFGQPAWVQSAHYPLDKRGQPCRHLLTIENGWGDCGNYNILVGLDDTGAPDQAYFEASCC